MSGFELSCPHCIRSASATFVSAHQGRLMGYLRGFIPWIAAGFVSGFVD